MPVDNAHGDASAESSSARVEQALELNFLIAHYLAQGPLRTAAEPLRQILEDTAQQLLPRRFDWQGNQHTRTYDELVREYPHIAGSELLNIVQAIANRDSSALLTAGGTVLGRTHKAPPTSSGVENSLVNKLRSRSANPAQSPMNRSTRLPLSVLASFRKLVRCHGHKYPTYCVLFDRTGRRMITGSDDFLIKIWCTRTGYLVKTFKGHQGMVSDIALNMENTLLASASTDGSVRIWNLKTGEPRAVLVANPQGRNKSITAVRFSPSPVPEIRFLASTCDAGLCRLYRWNRDTLVFDTNPIVIDARSEPRDTVSSFAFNHTGSRLAIATVKGYVSIYSTIAGAVNADGGGAAGWGEPKLISRIAAHDESITTLVFSSDGEMFLTGSIDGTVKVWRCSSTDIKWTSVTIDVKEPIPAPGDAPEPALDDLDNDAPRPSAAATTSGSAADAALAVEAAAVAATQSAEQAAEAIAALGTLTDAIAAGNITAVHQFQQSMAAGSVVTPAPQFSSQAESAPIPSAAMLALPNILLPIQPITALHDLPTSGTANGGAVELVSDNTLTAPANAELNAPPPAVAPMARVETNQVAWACNSMRIIASNNTGTVFAIDPRTGKICWQRRAHSVAEVYVLIPHPTDPRIAVSGGYDGRAIIWNVDTGDILREFRVGELLFDGSFSEDGLNFALTSDSGAAMLFGLGPEWAYDDANKMHEQMFANDYTATIMDENHFVADQQSQIPSYLVPHSALMDFDGRVYRRQRGPRFGLNIGMGMDSLKFGREESSRRAALEIELKHAYLDNRAAQAPIAEVRPARGRRRRSRPMVRTTTVEELPEADLPVILPVDDDSDDEEYTAGEEDDEEEEEEEEDEEDEGATDAMPGGTTGRSTRGAGEAGHAAASFDPNVRRSALELLRSRHNSESSTRSQRNVSQRSITWRSARRTIGEDDDDDDDDDVNIENFSDQGDNTMDVDGDDAGMAVGSGRRPVRTSGRIRRTRRGAFSDDEDAFDTVVVSEPHTAMSDEASGTNVRSTRGRRSYRNRISESPPAEEPVTSDDDFRPNRVSAVASSMSRGVRRGGFSGNISSGSADRPAPRRRGRPPLNRQASVVNVTHPARNRRVASDSEEDQGSASINNESTASSEFAAPRSRLRAAAAVGAEVNVDIMASSDSDNSDRQPALSGVRRSGRNAPSQQFNGASQEAEDSPRTRLRATRIGSNGFMGNVNDGYAGQPQRDSLGNHTVAASATAYSSSDLANGQMRVPGSVYAAGTPTSEGSFDSENGAGTSAESSRQRRSNRTRQQQVPPSRGSRGDGSTVQQASAEFSTHAAAKAATPELRIGSLYEPTDWVLATAPSTVPYRPQVGDIIVYFKEGHEDFWASPSRCKKLSDKMLPYVTIPALPVAVYGKVVSLRYAVGPPTYCTVKVQLLKNQSIEEMDLEAQGDHEMTRKYIQVQYHDCDGVPDFLILYSRYRASLRSALKCGDPVEVLFDEDQAHKAVITGFRDIKPTSRQTNVTRLIARNPWKSVIVEWAHADSDSNADGESKTEQVSPWELVYDDDNAEQEIPHETKAALLNIVDRLREINDFEWFAKNVDYRNDYPDYLLNIAYPMCLDTVYERLKNDFYRHIYAVSFDISLIQENADTFNDPGTLVPMAAQRMTAQYRLMLGQAIGSTNDGNDSDDSARGASQQSLVPSPTGRRTRESRRLTSTVRAGDAAAAAVSAVYIKSESPINTRQSRKRRSRSPSRSARRSSRRRIENDSDGSDYALDVGGADPAVDDSDVQFNEDQGEYDDDEDDGDHDRHGSHEEDDDDDDDDLYA